VSYRSVSRTSVIEHLHKELHSLRQSRALQEEVRAIELAPVALARIKNLQLDSLIEAAERILQVATVISIDARVFRHAMEYRARYQLSSQDAIVFASVVRHLTGSADPDRHYFVTEDKKAFADDPGIADELHAVNCELPTSFPEAALRLERPLPD
jgi:predicted nucleic acid-binding protein